MVIDESIIEEFSSKGCTPVVYMDENQILGYIGVSDTIKDDALDVIKALEKRGINTILLTGDNQKTAEYIASLAGIKNVIAHVLPQHKAREIQKLKDAGYRVAMVGDGINDAPALTIADVGIAMGTGTDVAIDSSDVTILGGSIAKIPSTMHYAQATMRVVRQNLFWAFFYNVVGIPIAAGILYPSFGILLNPAIAGFAMALSSVSVVTNSLRLKTIKG
jgi:P-type E1-E2 ATPase